MRKVDYRCLYDRSGNHWIRKVEDSYLLGMTDWGQYLIGKISAAQDFPDLNQFLEQDQPLCLLESSKASNEILMPLSAKIIGINPAVFSHPEFINLDCYEKGWLVKIAPADQIDGKVNQGAIKDWDGPEHFKAQIDGLFRKG